MVSTYSGENKYGLVMADKYLEARKRFENFLNKNNIIFAEKKGLLRRNTSEVKNAGLSEYRIFLNNPNFNNTADFIDIVVAGQISLEPKNVKHPGSLAVPLLTVHRSYSMAEAVNTLYCSVCLAEQTMLFKPMRMILSFAEASKSKNGYVRNNKARIRLEPEKIKVKEFRNGAQGINGHCSHLSAGLIEHKSPFIITENEMAAYLYRHNNYSNDMKLELKVLKNILALGV